MGRPMPVPPAARSGEERLEHPAGIGSGHAGTVIGHAQHDMAGLDAGRQVDRGASPGMGAHVVQQPGQDALQHLYRHRGPRRRGHDCDVQARGPGRSLQHGLQRHVRRWHGQHVGPRQLQQPGGQPLQPLQRIGGDGQQARAVGRGHVRLPGQLHRPSGGGDGRLELVRHMRREVPDIDGAALQRGCHRCDGCGQRRDLPRAGPGQGLHGAGPAGCDLPGLRRNRCDGAGDQARRRQRQRDADPQHRGA